MEENINEVQGTNNNDVFIVNGVANNSFMKESTTKISILSLLFSIFYPVGYFYKQWKEIKKNNEKYKNISPFWRGILYPIYMFPFTKIVQNLVIEKENIDLKSKTLSEEEKNTLKTEYQKINKLTPIPYIYLILILITFMIAFLKILKGGSAVVIWFIVSMSLTYLQKAIDKILPANHPKGKVLTFGDFLAVPTIAIAILVPTLFFTIKALHCWNLNGNTLSNTCENYSFNFPLDTEIKFDPKNNSFCKANQQEQLCFQRVVLDNPANFNLETLADGEPKTNIIMDKFSKQYSGNTTHCFKERIPNGPYYNVCIMKIEKQQPIYFAFLDYSFTGSIENLEKLMNSYKNL